MWRLELIPIAKDEVVEATNINTIATAILHPVKLSTLMFNAFTVYCENVHNVIYPLTTNSTQETVLQYSVKVVQYIPVADNINFTMNQNICFQLSNNNIYQSNAICL